MPDPILPDLLSAWTARDWYGLAVLVVVLVMRVLTTDDLLSVAQCQAAVVREKSRGGL